MLSPTNMLRRTDSWMVCWNSVKGEADMCRTPMGLKRENDRNKECVKECVKECDKSVVVGIGPCEDVSVDFWN